MEKENRFLYHKGAPILKNESVFILFLLICDAFQISDPFLTTFCDRTYLSAK